MFYLCVDSRSTNFMKTWLFLPFVFLCSSVIAQQAAYQAFDVDSAAQPRGGITFLNTFIQVNLRKPLSAEAKGIGGRVIVSGDVEADGSVSNVKAMNSIRPDCDREAVRVFSLFNAWKPAKKNGQPVRQQITFPIVFKSNTPFTYAGGVRIDYFDRDGKPALADSGSANFRRVTPIDTNGIPSGDIVVYELKDKNWKEHFRLPFVRKKINNHRITVGNQNSDQIWEGQVFTLNDAGVIINQDYYEKGKSIGPELSYYANGSISKKKENSKDRSAVITWYGNGQIKEIKVGDDSYLLTQDKPDQITAFWDSTGHQEVKDGSGYATYQTRTRSENDTIQYTFFTQQGAYANGLKQGVWRGRYADNSYFYEENYDKGICQSGKARSAGTDTVRYSSIGQPPEFPGGMEGLGKFLSSNLQYPRRAQQLGAQGKVFVSFVVCTDGTLCDYEVLKSVQSDLDFEAVRVVKKMSGKWKPGVQRGQKVRVKYNLPVNFSLY